MTKGMKLYNEPIEMRGTSISSWLVAAVALPITLLVLGLWTVVAAVMSGVDDMAGWLRS